MRKLFSVIVLTVLTITNVDAQMTSKEKAELYYKEAERYYSGYMDDDEYEKVLSYLSKAESALGSTNAKIVSLRVKAYYDKGKYDLAQSEFNTFNNKFMNTASSTLKDEMMRYFIKIENKLEEKNAWAAKVERTLPYFKFETCSWCEGSGYDYDEEKVGCGKGGYVREKINGFLVENWYNCDGGLLYCRGGWAYCAYCNGEGKIKKTKVTCDNCRGNKYHKDLIVYKGSEKLTYSEIKTIKEENYNRIKSMNQ